VCLVCVCLRAGLTPLCRARFNSMAKLARLTEKSFHPLGTFQDLRSLSLMVLKIIGALEKSKRARGGGDGFALRRRFKIP